MKITVLVQDRELGEIREGNGGVQILPYRQIYFTIKQNVAKTLFKLQTICRNYGQYNKNNIHVHNVYGILASNGQPPTQRVLQNRSLVSPRVIAYKRTM